MSACCRATGRRSTSNPGLRGNHSITLNSFLCHLKKCHVPELTPACLLSVTSTGQFSWFALALLPGSSPVTAALPALYAAAAAMLLELQLKQSKSWECRSGEPTFLQHFQIWRGGVALSHFSDFVLFFYDCFVFCFLSAPRRHTMNNLYFLLALSCMFPVVVVYVFFYSWASAQSPVCVLGQRTATEVFFPTSPLKNWKLHWKPSCALSVLTLQLPY